MRIYLQILLLLYCIDYSLIAMAQEKQGQARIDSLLKQLPNAREDTNKIKLLNDLSATYGYINSDEGIKAGEQALALSKKLNWEKGTAAAMNAIGLNYEGKSDYPGAL